MVTTLPHLSTSLKAILPFMLGNKRRSGWLKTAVTTFLRRAPQRSTHKVSHPDHVKQQIVAETSGSVVTESLFHNHGLNSFVLLNY
ncbi:hypothetical protein HanIR_Chr17g0874801 [Helianthus annuus]|nr:hypothetical protein HanIR_Chr17g0874801 [Helianthus annuus]